ncbi:MAG TPA: hypothetical protein VNZ53_04155 [Steroidobacteraceae bacterium]|jgi:hypothetical protein|nr:hypothetical protein [Steroidobacteraceae bacterium]
MASRKHNKTKGGNAEYRRSVEMHAQQSVGTDDQTGSLHGTGCDVLADGGCPQLTLAQAAAAGTVPAKTPGGQQ